MDATYSNYPRHQTVQTNIRTSMANRVSQLFGRRRGESDHIGSSTRTSAACEVPIFMSLSTNQLVSHERVQNLSESQQRQMRPDTILGSSVYSESPGQFHQPRFVEQIDDDCPRSQASIQDLEAGTTCTSYASDTQILREKHRRRKRVAESTRQKIASKKRLSMAFGITLLATVIVYLVLAVTFTAQGLMFHLLSIISILALTGIFLHSTIRMIMLQKRRRARRARHQNWHGSAGRSFTTTSSRSCSETSVDPVVDPVPEKPVKIRMGPEEVLTTTPRGKNKKVIRQPPPVYGNFRDSSRMNPEMVFWKKLAPPPTTPTYEEAMDDAQTAVGLQPPTYVSPKRERQLDTEDRVIDFHPLERERFVGLMGNTMFSHQGP